MHEFIEAFRFIAHNGAVAGQPGLPSLAHLTLETLKVGAIGLAISLVIAMPLGVWLGHICTAARSWRSTSATSGARCRASSVLAIGDAFLGLGLTVVELALVILAVPPIITNAYLGVDGVDRDLVDAARGMGMTEREILRRVELPLALPLIFAGIRTAAVFVISTTTIASLAGFSGSLGDIIANETSYHFSGRARRGDLRGGAGAGRRGRARARAAGAHAPRGRAPESAARASSTGRRPRSPTSNPIVSYLFRSKKSQTRRLRMPDTRWSRLRTGGGRTAALFAVTALSVGLAACGSSSSTSSSSSSSTATTAAASGPGVGKPAVTIGDKNFPEENILGALYAQALQAKGYKVTLKDNVGSSEIIYKALTAGQIDMYPEYTGVLLSAIAGQTKNPTSAAAAYQQAKAFVESKGFTLLDYTPFFDSNALATLPSVRERTQPGEHRRPEAARQEGQARRGARNSRRALRACSGSRRNTAWTRRSCRSRSNCPTRRSKAVR